MIIKSDALKFLRQRKQGEIDLFITSPPYNMKTNVGGALASKCKSDIWNKPELRNGYSDYGDAIPYDKYIQWQRDCLTEMLRILPDNGAIFYNHKYRIQKGLLLDRHEIIEGFPLRQIIIWSRGCGVNFNRTYFLPTYEVIYLIAKPAFKLKKGASSISDVWSFPPEKKNPHPAPFPVQLPLNILQSVEVGLVSDPFLGSGTTALACQRMGIPFMGCDISQKYIDLTNQRLNSELVFENERNNHD